MKKIAKALTAMLLLSVMLSGCKQVESENPNDQQTQTESSPKQTEELPTPSDQFDYCLSDSKTAIWISGYHGSSDRVIIPSEIDNLPVVTILRNAFTDKGLRSVTFPNTIRVIKSYAFSNNPKLTQIQFGEQSQLELIDPCAFANCTALSKVDLSETKLDTIENGAFLNCSGLTEIIFCDTITRIGRAAFSGCSSLKTVDLPKELLTIDREAFANCSALETVTIPTKLRLDGLDGISFSENPALKKIIFADGREALDGYAFFFIESNAEVVIPASVKTFGPGTFFVKGKITFRFLGDCPTQTEGISSEFHGTPTILYDPTTKGWEDCVWKDQYTVKPNQS